MSIPLSGASQPTTPADDAIFTRPSAMGTWNNCQLSVQATAYPTYDNTSTMQASRGTGMHLAIEAYQNHEGFANLETFRVAWTQHMADRGEDIRPLTTPDRILEVATEIWVGYNNWINQFWHPYGKHLNIVATEQHLETFLDYAPDGREVWLRGTPDTVVAKPDSHMVIDWKTSTSGWAKNKTADMTQHVAYALLLEANGFDHVDEAMYVVYNFAKGTWAWDDYRLPISFDHKMTVRHEFTQMGRVLSVQGASGTPQKRGASWGAEGRGWWCSEVWCGWFDHCDAKFLLDDGKADAKRDNTITWRKK